MYIFPLFALPEHVCRHTCVRMKTDDMSTAKDVRAAIYDAVRRRCGRRARRHGVLFARDIRGDDANDGSKRDEDVGRVRAERRIVVWMFEMEFAVCRVRAERRAGRGSVRVVSRFAQRGERARGARAIDYE